MSNGSPLARLLFPELAAELDRALGSQQSDASRLNRRIDEAAGAARAGGLGRAAFDGVSEPEADRFERSFAAARTVASWAGLELPEPEAFWEAGADRAVLARALMADDELLAIPAPHGLGEERWTELFRAAARRRGTPLALASPLEIAPEVSAEFAVLDVPARHAARVASGGGRAAPVQWSLRLVPAGESPPRMGLNHSHGPHPTLPEMLMLQLMRFAQGEEAVDRQSLTWLAGTLAEGRFAARHLFDTTARSVRVNTREPGNQGPHLGVRPPV